MDVRRLGAVVEEASNASGGLRLAGHFMSHARLAVLFGGKAETTGS